MSIRLRLAAIVLAVLVPALVATVWGITSLYDQQREAAEESLTELTKALAVVIERELAQRDATLRTLAASPSLVSEDLKTFYDYASIVATLESRATVASPSNERTIILSTLEHQQLLNTRMPYGSALPVGRAFSELRKSAAPQATLVSDLYFAPIGKQFSYAVQVPVTRNGEVLYWLTMGQHAKTLQRLLEDQRLRPGWNAAIVDRTGTVVARRLRPAEFVGKPATEDFRRRLGQKKEDLFETVRLDGATVLTAYTGIEHSGWTFAVSMPKEDLLAGQKTLQTAVFLVLCLFALGLWVASRASKLIAGSITDLVDLARQLGRGEVLRPRASGLVETELVARQLQAASERISSASGEMEHRVREAVTASRKAQDALLQNQKMEALGRLTGGIAHDFNNLLQTMSTGIEVAALVSTDPRAKTSLESGKNAIRRAVKLTRQLMTFGRQQVSDRSVIGLARDMTGFQDLVRGAVRSNIDLAFDFPEDLWPITVDVVQLELALLNAALNAKDAMPRGGKLTIGARNLEIAGAEHPSGLAPGEYVQISVEDSGEGIPASMLERVFEPFFTTKEVGQGTGLGLAQVYAFATQSNGSATIESEVGKGTTLHLFIPRSHAGKQEEAPAAARQTRPTKGTVLFTEDDPLIHEVAVPALRLAGFRVIAALNGQAALAHLESDPGIDVLFSDIVMAGGMSGVELAKIVEERFPAVRIVLATGYTEAIPDSASVRVLMKPYQLDELKEALNEAISGAGTQAPAQA